MLGRECKQFVQKLAKSAGKIAAGEESATRLALQAARLTAEPVRGLQRSLL
jgi:hypothetical protein